MKSRNLSTKLALFAASVLLLIPLLTAEMRVEATLTISSNETNTTALSDGNHTNFPEDGADETIPDETTEDEAPPAKDVLRFNFRFGFFEDDQTPKLDGEIEMEDLKGLLCKTEQFLTEVLQDSINKDSVQVQMSEIDWFVVEEPLEFNLYFTTGFDPMVDRTLLIKAIEELGTEGLTQYITDYVWDAEPQDVSMFTHVSRVEFDAFVQPPVKGRIQSVDCTKRTLHLSSWFAFIRDISTDVENGIPIEQVEGLMCQTETFLTDLLQEAINSDSIQLKTKNIDWDYDMTRQERPLTVNFTIQYESTDPFTQAPDEAVVANTMKNLGDDDIQTYITEYVWKSEPFYSSIFYSAVRARFNVVDEGVKGQLKSVRCPVDGVGVEVARQAVFVTQPKKDTMLDDLGEALSVYQATDYRTRNYRTVEMGNETDSISASNVTLNSTRVSEDEDDPMMEMPYEDILDESETLPDEVLRVTLYFTFLDPPNSISKKDIKGAVCKVQDFLSDLYDDATGGSNTAIFANDVDWNDTENWNDSFDEGSEKPFRISFSIDPSVEEETLLEAMENADWSQFVIDDMIMAALPSKMLAHVSEVKYTANMTAPVEGRVAVFACEGN